MGNSSKITLLPLLVSIYCVLYFLLFAVPIFLSGFDVSAFEGGKLELITVLFAFLLYLVGTIYAWVNKKISGILICLWHFMVWIFSLFLWKDAGMVVVLILPVLYAGVFLLDQGLKEEKPGIAEHKNTGKQILQILIINYTAIYLIIVISNIIPAFGVNYPSSVDELVVWNYTSPLGVLLLLSLGLYLLGFILSWRFELTSGILFVIWYLLIIYLGSRFPEFANSGPWAISGMVILVQAIIYISRSVKKRKIFVKD